jgi:hypothetical protein
MNMNKFCVGTLLVCGGTAMAAPAANKFATSTQTMTCGAAQFKLDSTCAKPREEGDLNVCKPQVLTVVAAGKTAQKTLPELSTSNLKNYKAVGGKPSDLYVVSWGCGGAGAASVASLYYSVGGGNAEASESMAYYDAQGILIQHDKDARYTKAIGEAKMTPVPSIMPARVR